MNNGELITAKARDRVAFAYASLQPFSHGHQKSIADRMAQGVIDLLEIVQIEANYGK